MEGPVERRLAAILAADVVGYAAMMERAEEATFSEIGRLRRDMIEPALARHKGRLIKTTGDGIFAEFSSPISALNYALDVQEQLAASGSPVQLRIGINLGDVIVDEQGDVFGEGINVAARLEGLAHPGGILISGKVHSEVEGKVEVSFLDCGERQLKNIAKPVRAYAVDAATTRALSSTSKLSSGALLLPDKPSIAVLPFQNMSGDPEQEYFADGVVEDIITALSHFKSLFVTARNSTFTYKGRAVDVKQVGRELGVRYILEGSVRKAANRLRITGQLIDAATGAHLWADRFDGATSEVFELQDSVAENVAWAIAPKLQEAEIERAKRKPSANLDAYDHYLRALPNSRKPTREGTDDALSLLRNALMIDPDFASAYGLTALCYQQRKANGWCVDLEKETAEAERAARRAADLGRNDADALSWSALTLAYVVGEVEAGAALVERALHLNPNSAYAWRYDAWIRGWLGQPERAVESALRAMRLSPVDPMLWSFQAALAYAHFFAGRYQEAISCARASLREKTNQEALRVMAVSSALDNQLDQARKSTTELLRLNPSLRISGLKWLPFRRADDWAHYEHGLRMAGLPE